MRKFFIPLLSTVFGVGYLPLMPGTFGSIAGLLLYQAVRGNFWIYGAAILFTGGTGFFTAGEAEKAFGKKDPRCVVIDEVAGMLVCFLFVPYSFTTMLIGFFFFRLLDTLKPFPAARLQDLHGSVGIMSDDLVAGVYTNIMLQVVVRCASLRIS